MRITDFKTFESAETRASIFKKGDRVLLKANCTYFYRKLGDAGMYSTWKPSSKGYSMPEFDIWALAEITDISAPFSKVKPASRYGLGSKLVSDSMHKVKILTFEMRSAKLIKAYEIVNIGGVFQEYVKYCSQSAIFARIDSLWTQEESMTLAPEWLVKAYEKHKDQEILQKWGEIYEIPKGTDYFSIVSGGYTTEIKKVKATGTVVGKGGGFSFCKDVLNATEELCTYVELSGSDTKACAFVLSTTQKTNPDLEDKVLQVAEKIGDMTGFTFYKSELQNFPSDKQIDKNFPVLYTAHRLLMKADDDLLTVEAFMKDEKSAEKLRDFIKDEIKEDLNFIIEYIDEESIEKRSGAIKLVDTADLVSMIKNSDMDLEKLKHDSRGIGIMLDLF